MCKRILLLVLLLPVSAFAQRKADKKEMSLLLQHFHYLNDPAVVNRPSGSPAEMKAAGYIANQFKEAGLVPEEGGNGYIQSFIFDEGKMPGENTVLTLNDTLLELNKDYFPLPFSANGAAKGNPMISVQEPANVWMINLKEALDNSVAPVKDLTEFLYHRAKLAAGSGATAVIFYTTDPTVSAPEFNPRDTLPVLKIPVVYIKPAAAARFLEDETASVSVNMTVHIGERIMAGHNVAGYINNDARTTILVSTHFDQRGDGKTSDNSLATAGLIELARMLKDSRKLRDNNYLFIDFSGNETGGLGMIYFLRHHEMDPGKFNCWINISSMVTGSNGEKIMAFGTATSPDWDGIIRKANEDGLSISQEAGEHDGSSKNAFYAQNIPVLLLSAGGKNNSTGMQDARAGLPVLKFVYNLIREVNEKGQLAFANNSATGR